MDPASTDGDKLLSCSTVYPCDSESRSKWTGPIGDAWHGATSLLTLYRLTEDDVHIQMLCGWTHVYCSAIRRPVRGFRIDTAPPSQHLCRDVRAQNMTRIVYRQCNCTCDIVHPTYVRSTKEYTLAKTTPLQRTGRVSPQMLSLIVSRNISPGYPQFASVD